MAGREHHIVAQRRKQRQEDLREMLSAGKHVEHVLKICERIEKEGDEAPLTALKVVIDTKLRLISKYLPDLKAVEVTGEDGGPLIIKGTLEIVRPKL